MTDLIHASKNNFSIFVTKCKEIRFDILIKMRTGKTFLGNGDTVVA